MIMMTSEDPVATGLVDSLARPGGNITGLTRLTRELSGKRLELFSEVLPAISRVGGPWTQGVLVLKSIGCGARSKDTASIARGTRSEPRFGGDISSCSQEARKRAHRGWQ